MNKNILFLITLIFFSSHAKAGIVEISAMYSYKKTNYDALNYEAQEQGTGGISYYFWEMSALELTYSRGAGIEVHPTETIYQDVTAYGASLVFTFANRDSAFKPYIKGGVSYLIKRLSYFYPVGSSTQATAPTQMFGLAPTAGLGFKYMLTQQFGIKAGVDVASQTFTSGSTSVTVYDFAATGGLSFLF